MRPRDEQIGVRHIGTKCLPSNSNREHIPDPSLTRIRFPEMVAPDPLNGPHPAKDRRQQFTDGEVFYPLAAVCRPDPRALEEAVPANAPGITTPSLRIIIPPCELSA